MSCIGNIFSNTTSKLIDENYAIFNNIIDILRELSSPQKLDDSNNLKILASALRVLSALYLDLKPFSTDTCEFLINQIIKYLYLGTNFFPTPVGTFRAHSTSNSDSGVATSSSEISDSDDLNDKYQILSYYDSTIVENKKMKHHQKSEIMQQPVSGISSDKTANSFLNMFLHFTLAKF